MQIKSQWNSISSVVGWSLPKQQEMSVDKNVEKLGPWALSVGMQNGAVTMEKRYGASSKD